MVRARARAESAAQIDKIQESELIGKARGGDSGSFSALVEAYQERAVHAAYSFTGNLEDARDLAQEAFVKAYQNLAGFQSESRFYTWFYRILMNTCKDFLRKQKLRRTFSFWLPQEEGDEETSALSNVAERSENAAQAAANRDLGRVVNEALGELPFRQRSVFALRYMEGMTLEEIAQCQSISVGAVKAHLWHACQKMRGKLKDVLGDGL
jgi:RNA polymerase sigma-70 factor, ECF subfamily